jgi:hypothetical protein
MIRPTLIHPVKVELTQIDPATTPAKDPEFGEPTGKPVYLAPVTITAQLALGTTRAFEQRPGGDDERSDGHITVRIDTFAVEAPGRTLKKGDRITKLYVGQATETAVNWHIIQVEPRAHYDGRPWLYFLFYKQIKSLAEVA